MKGKTFKTQNVFVCLSVITLVTVTLAILISNGHLFQVFFFTDAQDTGMDFFNQLVAVHTKNPYTEFKNLYPPLANLFFYLLQLFIPDSIKATWPHSHQDTIAMVGTINDLRLTQSALLVFLFYTMISLVCIFYLCNSILKSPGTALCVTLTSGIFSAVERGNVILIAFICLLYYIKNYQSENKVKKELALLALAASFGFKLYPAIFGILLLKNKDFYGAFRAALYGILLTILPLLFFGGFEGVSNWFDVLMYRSGIDGHAVSTSTASESFSFILHYIIIAICIILVIIDFIPFKNNKMFIFHSERLFLITTIMLLLVHGTKDFYLAYYIIPMLFLFKEESKITLSTIPEFASYMLLLLPLGINRLSHTVIFLFGIGIIIRRLINNNNQLIKTILSDNKNKEQIE